MGVYGRFRPRVGLILEPADAVGFSFERFVGRLGSGTHRPVRPDATPHIGPGVPPGRMRSCFAASAQRLAVPVEQLIEPAAKIVGQTPVPETSSLDRNPHTAHVCVTGEVASVVSENDLLTIGVTPAGRILERRIGAP